MSGVYERLKKLNDNNKEEYKRLYSLEKRQSYRKIMEEHSIWLVVNENNKWYLRRKSDGSLIFLSHVGDLFDFLNKDVVYITNLSLLKNAKIIGYYNFKKEDWYYINNPKMSYRHYNSISIIRVEDMEKYVGKAVLLNKMSVIVQKNVYSILISLDNKDIVVVSDIVLRLTYGVTFTSISVDKINISNFDTCLVKSLAGFFSNCGDTERINLKNFNTSRIQDFSYMFNECENLEELSIEEIRTDNAKTFECMFNGCVSLTSLNLNHFKVYNVVCFESMFEDCSTLEEVKLDKWVLNFDSQLYLTRMFSGCRRLKVDGSFEGVFKELLKSNITTITMFSDTKYENL